MTMRTATTPPAMPAYSATFMEAAGAESCTARGPLAAEHREALARAPARPPPIPAPLPVLQPRERPGAPEGLAWREHALLPGAVDRTRPAALLSVPASPCSPGWSVLRSARRPPASPELGGARPEGCSGTIVLGAASKEARELHWPPGSGLHRVSCWSPPPQATQPPTHPPTGPVVPLLPAHPHVRLLRGLTVRVMLQDSVPTSLLEVQT